MVAHALLSLFVLLGLLGRTCIWVSSYKDNGFYRNFLVYFYYFVASNVSGDDVTMSNLIVHSITNLSTSCFLLYYYNIPINCIHVDIHNGKYYFYDI